MSSGFSSLDFGRTRNLQLYTLFAFDKNRQIMLQAYKEGQEEKKLEGKVDVISLDVQKDLCEQWEARPSLPDVIVSKLHKALGSAGDPVHDACLKHYDELMAKHKEEFEARNLIPIACELQLSSREKMTSFLQRIASVTSLINANSTPCSAPQWCMFDRRTPDSSALPPFPVVVKPKSTHGKRMGLVFDLPGLISLTRSEEYPNDEFSIEQYVPHNGVVYKVYVIAQHIFVGKRPSLPNANSPTAESLKAFAAEVKGEYVAVSPPAAGAQEANGVHCESPGYVVFYSDVLTNREGTVRCQRLQESKKPCIDESLDPSVVTVIKLAIEHEWDLEMFGFDVLVHKDTRKHFVVDCNVFPGYKGVDDYLVHMNKLFIRHGIRRGLKEDVARLNSNDDNVKSFCVQSLKEWSDKDVCLSDIAVTRMVDSRIFKVKLLKDKRPDVTLRRALVAFYNWEKPKRTIHDEVNFVGNVSKRLSDVGLGPFQYNDINASYYGCERFLGRIEEWVTGYTLLKALKKVETDWDAMFSCLGRSLAKFHSLMHNETFKKSIINYHFGSIMPDGPPLCYTLLETWRRCAVISTEKSGLSRSQQWSDFYKEFLQYIDIESVKKTVHAALQSKQSTRFVYSHFDLNLSNAIVDDNAKPTKVTLIDVEWCGPNLAVYDFAKLISSLELQISRGEVDLNMEQVNVFLKRMIVAYLETVGVLTEGVDEEQREKEVSDFLCDCYTFVPIACMLNVYSNFVHANFDGQLSDTVSEGTELGKRGTNFNWIRHAFDHFACFKKYYSRLQALSAKTADEHD